LIVLFKVNVSTNNLPRYPPDSHQFQNAVYWRTWASVLEFNSTCLL